MKTTISILAEPLMPAFYRPANATRSLPAVTMWPKLPMRVGKHEIVPDYLLRLDHPGQCSQLVVLEMNEAGPSAASLHRERILSKAGIQVMRLPHDASEETFDRKLAAAVARGTGRITRVLGVHTERQPPPNPREAHCN